MGVAGGRAGLGRRVTVQRSTARLGAKAEQVAGRARCRAQQAEQGGPSEAADGLHRGEASSSVVSSAAQQRRQARWDRGMIMCSTKHRGARGAPVRLGYLFCFIGFDWPAVFIGLNLDCDG